ncbi:MAG: hypothetical protein OXE95_07495 [Chloroflexi bacterium]|nr:hypothetical protein [Chloroflexota bacterium]MCY4247400.1 hypothetical protein [Chloroflexota bacterium]
MSEFGKSLLKGAKQAADIAAGRAKPGTYRITAYDDKGTPLVIADFSEDVLTRIDTEIAAERERTQPAEPATIRQLTNTIAK